MADKIDFLSAIFVNTVMDFKNYTLLKERAYFIDLTTLTNKIIDRLEQIIKTKKSIRPGASITVPISQTFDLDIKFYKGISRRGREYMKQAGAEGSDALYFSETADENGTLEIYINDSKDNQYYYKDKSFDEIIKGRLPKFLRDILRHEISHAYEDIVRDISAYSGNEDLSDDKKYFNDDSELNAYFIQLVPGEIEVSQVVQHYIRKGDVNTATRELLTRLQNKEFVEHLTPENKNWFVKTVYTYVKMLVDKLQKAVNMSNEVHPSNPQVSQ